MLNMRPCDDHENSDGRRAPPKTGAFVASASSEGLSFWTQAIIPKRGVVGNMGRD